jgi:hypothetical protein
MKLAAESKFSASSEFETLSDVTHPNRDASSTDLAFI